MTLHGEIFEEAGVRRLERFIRRRVPERLVSDVTQSALCEAWAARDRAEHAGFVFGVAKHEAFDARRREDLEAPFDDGAVGAVAQPPAALLSEVLAYVARRPRLKRAMEWLLRE